MTRVSSAMAQRGRLIYSVSAMVIAVSVLAVEVTAKRREGQAGLANLEIALKQPTAFGNKKLPAGRYRVALKGDGLVLKEARTMLTKAVVPAKIKEMSEVASEARAEVRQKRKSTLIVVRYRDREYTVSGVPTMIDRKAGPKVDLASSKLGFGVSGGIPDAKSDEELAVNALNRYEKEIKHCGDAALKQHWTTDHPRFRRCVCPLTKKWRLPKVEKELRFHRVLTKRKSGYSITVTPGGKVADCRVWTGSKPPQEEKTQAPHTPAVDG